MTSKPSAPPAFPVYSVAGRGGGWRLLGDGRTDLSGLSAPEVRALFLIAGPTAAATGDMRSALRKLASALPDPLRSSAESAATSVVVDPAPWGRVDRARPDPPLLDAVQTAVVERREVELDYVDRRGAETRRIVQPLGLAAKGGTWYLVADTEAGQRTFRVDRIAGVDETGAPAQRPDGFDLDDVWSLVAARVDEIRLPYVARCDADHAMLGPLRFVFQERVSVGEAGGGGRVDIVIRGWNLDQLAAEIAGFGGAVTVHDPPELRHRLGEIGRELLATYEPCPAVCRRGISARPVGC